MRPQPAGGCFQPSPNLIAPKTIKKPHNDDEFLDNDQVVNMDKVLRNPGSWKCSCGKEVNTERGLKIHRTKMGCGAEEKQRVTLDNSSVSKASEGISPVTNHSADVLYVSPAEEVHEGRKSIKWPGSNMLEEWKEFQESVLKKLDTNSNSNLLKDRLSNLSKSIYEVGVGKFGAQEAKISRGGEGVSRRQGLIKQVRSEIKSLKRRWKVSIVEEKNAIDELVKEARGRLKRMQKVERAAKRKKERRKANEGFIKDPFKYAKGLLEAKKSGNLQAGKQEIDSYLKATYSAADRNEELGMPPVLDRPTCPGKEFDLRDLALYEVTEVVRKARGKSAAGPNGVSYRVFKNCPQLLKLLWRMLRAAWRKRYVHPEWQVAEGVFIPKEEVSSKISQFRPIALLNVEGKIYLSVLARRLTRYLLANGFIDTSVQKAGIPGFSGCLEHSSVIWDTIRKAKSQKGKVSVVWLDLVNAYGSVPHKMVEFALEFFWVPFCLRQLIREYFDNFKFRFSAGQVTSSWQKLEVGIAMGCAISPLLFVLVMEVILRAGRGVGKGVEVAEGVFIPPLRAFMDDITIVEESHQQMIRVVSRLEECVSWCKMKFKAVKCRSLVIEAGKVTEKPVEVSGEVIPNIKKQGVKSLGRWYKYPVSDRGRSKEFMLQVDEGVKAIDKSWLRGKWKCWSYHHVLLPKLLWPLTVYDIPLSAVEAAEKRINRFLRKWLSVPRCLSSVAFYNNSFMLQLPFKALTEEFKVAKVRLHEMLVNSADRITRLVEPVLGAGKKWSVAEAAVEAKNRLRFEEIRGHVQIGRCGIGFHQKKKRDKVKRSAVCNAIRDGEEEQRFVKAVQMSSQGRSTAWEGVLERKITWQDFWKMDAMRIGFLLKSVYDCLPTKRNLKVWNYSEDNRCSRCQALETVEHVLCACKVSLGEGRYMWRHNKVLEMIYSVVKEAEFKLNEFQSIQFISDKGIKYGDTVIKNKIEDKWDVLVDLERRLVFPSEIVVTNLRPDMVLIERSKKKVWIMELTVPWEDRMMESNVRKSSKYEDLRQECEDAGWSARCFAVEVGCRGFAGQSLRLFLKALGMNGRHLSSTIEKVAVAAEKASAWLWMKRSETWVKNQ